MRFGREQDNKYELICVVIDSNFMIIFKHYLDLKADENGREKLFV